MDAKQILDAIKLLGKKDKVFEYNDNGAVVKVNGKIIMDFVNEELIVSF